MKFILGSGEVLRERLQKFPWSNSFLPSKILVAAIIDDKMVGACGIRSVFNILTLYVKKGYRGQGIGTQLLDKTTSVARKRGFSFILLSVFSRKVRVLHLFSKCGFLDVVRPRKFTQIVMILPMDFKSKLLYTFLSVMCSILPDIFVACIIRRIYKITVTNE